MFPSRSPSAIPQTFLWTWLSNAIVSDRYAMHELLSRANLTGISWRSRNWIQTWRTWSELQLQETKHLANQTLCIDKWWMICDQDHGGKDVCSQVVVLKLMRLEERILWSRRPPLLHRQADLQMKRTHSAALPFSLDLHDQTPQTVCYKLHAKPWIQIKSNGSLWHHGSVFLSVHS